MLLSSESWDAEKHSNRKIVEIVIPW